MFLLHETGDLHVLGRVIFLVNASSIVHVKRVVLVAIDYW